MAPNTKRLESARAIKFRATGSIRKIFREKTETKTKKLAEGSVVEKVRGMRCSTLVACHGKQMMPYKLSNEVFIQMLCVAQRACAARIR